MIIIRTDGKKTYATFVNLDIRDPVYQICSEIYSRNRDDYFNRVYEIVRGKVSLPEDGIYLLKGNKIYQYDEKGAKKEGTDISKYTEQFSNQGKSLNNLPSELCCKVQSAITEWLNTLFSKKSDNQIIDAKSFSLPDENFIWEEDVSRELTNLFKKVLNNPNDFVERIKDVFFDLSTTDCVCCINDKRGTFLIKGESVIRYDKTKYLDSLEKLISDNFFKEDARSIFARCCNIILYNMDFPIRIIEKSDDNLFVIYNGDKYAAIKRKGKSFVGYYEEHPYYEYIKCLYESTPRSKVNIIHVSAMETQKNVWIFGNWTTWVKDTSSEYRTAEAAGNLNKREFKLSNGQKGFFSPNGYVEIEGCPGVILDFGNPIPAYEV